MPLGPEKQHPGTIRLFFRRLPGAFLILTFLSGILLPPLLERPEARKSAGLLYYRVKKGDSLTRIARRFRTSVRRISALNRLNPRSVLKAGSRLKIRQGERRAAGKRSWKKKRWAARRYSRKRRWKRKRSDPEKHSWKRMGAAHVLLPYNYRAPRPRRKVYTGRHYAAVLYSRGFLMGDAVYLEIRRRKGRPYPEQFQVLFDGEVLPLTRRPWGHRALFAFAPHKRHGVKTLRIIARFNQPDNVQTAASRPNAQTPRDNKKKRKKYRRARRMRLVLKKDETRDFRLRVGWKKFRTVHWKIYQGNYDRPRKKPTPEQIQRWREIRRKRRELIRASNVKKREIYALRTEDKLDGRLAHPRGHHKITSPFYVKRRIVKYYRKNGKRRYRRPYNLRHTGVDLKGLHGKPLYAAASGRVVSARRMHYEGNFVVIDHGNGVTTGYMHQSKMLVREGQRVKAGQLIGRSGSTGFVTGPHLHWNLRIRGVYVSPLSLLSLPIRR